MFKKHPFLLSLVLTLFLTSSVFGTTYKTIRNNKWSPSTPATNFKSSDDFEIYHKATLYGIDLQSGGSITVKSGGQLTLNWSAFFRSGSSIYVEPGGTLNVTQLTLSNYSDDFVIDGSINTTNGTVANYQSGVITYNDGASWYLNQMSMVNYGNIILNEDADWSNGSVSFSLGTVEINSELEIKNLSLQNNATIIGYGQVNLKNGNGTFSSNGTINNCTGNGCIPPSTVGTITYLAAAGTNNTLETSSGGNVPPLNCGVTLQVLEDLTITSDETVGEIIVSPGVILTIEADRSLTVCEGINNGGEVIIENKGSLVQTAAADLNQGEGKYEIHREGSSSSNSYNSWSSPMKYLSIEDVFTGDNDCDIFAFDGIDQAWKYDYVPGTQSLCNGNAVTFPASICMPGGDGLMDAGRGYFAPGRATPKREIVGEVNNGDVLIDVYVTSLGHNPRWDDDDWNLVGNPYPSAIDLDEFWAENSDVITGSFYFWVDDDQNDYHQSQDYAVFADGVGTTANGGTAKRYVPAGQGFWVYAKKNGTVKFTNAMRVDGNNLNLYKRSQDLPSFLYLTVENDSGNYNQCAVGFNPTASDLFDESSDAPKGEAGTALSVGSFIGNVPYSIQALKEINENESKTVELSLRTTNVGMHVFKVDSFQNMGGEYAVYLQDGLTGDITNLKTADYSVYLDTGNYDNRFSLLFENNGTPASVEELQESSLVIAYQNSGDIIVEATEGLNGIEQVFIYDLLGKQIYSSRTLNQKRVVVSGISLHTGVYVVKCKLENGFEQSIKITVTN